MTRTKEVADLVGALKDLLTMPEFDGTQYTSKVRQVAKHKARRVIEEYEARNENPEHS
jgi:hypothetical protein